MPSRVAINRIGKGGTMRGQDRWPWHVEALRTIAVAAYEKYIPHRLCPGPGLATCCWTTWQLGYAE